jgi:DtxR family manganese transport transcriptional regulator
MKKGLKKAEVEAKSKRPVEKLAADAHRRTRRAHVTEIAEDYVEAIDDLVQTLGEARAVDLAERLGVTHVTVTKTIGRLSRAGLVTSRPYRSIFLTDEGAKMAARARRRHQIVVELLTTLGVSNATAHADAEGIEHHVSQETLKAMERFVHQKIQ